MEGAFGSRPRVMIVRRKVVVLEYSTNQTILTWHHNGELVTHAADEEALDIGFDHWNWLRHWNLKGNFWNSCKVTFGQDSVLQKVFSHQLNHLKSPKFEHLGVENKRLMG